MFSCLQIDCPSKSCVQIHLEPVHLGADGFKLIFEVFDVLFEFCGRDAEHLLCLFVGNVEEGIANLVPVVVDS